MAGDQFFGKAVDGWGWSVRMWGGGPQDIPLTLILSPKGRGDVGARGGSVHAVMVGVHLRRNFSYEQNGKAVGRDFDGE
jgi:hypothetical protein